MGDNGTHNTIACHIHSSSQHIQQAINADNQGNAFNGQTDLLQHEG
jgi:hypothetical protein